jgi:hypothetical protein
LSFLELIAFPVSTQPSSSTAELTVEQSDAFLETVRHIGTRLTGTTDMIAEALLNSGELTKSKISYENLQPVLKG